MLATKKLIQSEKVSGYDSLAEENKKLFTKFLTNFYYDAWGLEARKTIKALSIKECNDAGSKYLRFDYMIYNRKDWLHVYKNKNGEIEWY